MTHNCAFLQKRVVVISLLALPMLLFAPQASFGQMTWKCAMEKTPFLGRSDHQILAFDNKVWVLPGSSDNKTNREDIWYSADGANWTCAVKKAPFSTRCYYTALSFNGSMWIIAGGDYC